MNSSEQLKVGPRAKCDQVVYEAIAKAAETILTGRSRCDNSDNHGYRSSSGQNMTASKMGGASSRFHLEMEEVSAVRSILQMWKRSLHVPLRLDVYYEYCTDPNAPEQNTRKELLERWCIDYLPSNEHYANNHNNTSPRHNSDETIAQLRQVVKRVVIQLRVLHSLTRMMPAYRLHHALMDDLQHGSRSHALSNLNRPLGSGPGLGGGYYHNAGNFSYGGNESAENNNARQNVRDLVGGQINYSFYVSDTVAPNQRLASDATLFSSNTNNPFARHDLNPIPTPFGVLHLAVNYDEGLCVENILANRAKRILEWAEMRSVPMAVPSAVQTSKDIKGNGRYEAESHDHLNQQNSPMRHSSQSRAIPIQGNFTSNEGDHRLQRMQSTSSRSFHDCDGSHDNGQRPYLKQMSMPNRHAMGPLSASPNVVSDHFARIHQMPNIERPKSAEPGYIRDHLSSDTGNAFGQQSAKVLSGLSLALMGEDLGQGNVHEPLTVCSVDAATSSVPPSNTDSASIRQRLAFHHPPPSFDEQSLRRTSSSPNDSAPFERAKPSSTYGYAYNNGIVIPPSNFSKSGLHAVSRGASPITVPIVNTPPQPMFIGSMQRGGTIGINSNPTSGQDTGRDQDVPFKNPTSLQKAPAENIGASGVSNSSGKLAHTQSALQIPGARNASPQYPKESLLPPLNSLDALASSPFTFALSQSVAPGKNSSGPPLSSSPGVSVFSSLVMGKGSAAFGPFDEGFPLALTSGGGSSTVYASSSLVPSRSNCDRISRSAVGKQDETDNDCEEMPFAVDMEFSNQSSLTTSKVSRQNSAIELGASSGTNMSSQVVTSLAHRCSTAGRLKLFSSIDNQQGAGENSIVDKSFVEDQLKDFRTFRDSITASGFLHPTDK
mmetsp:Transcript_22472/g.33291  ORF Transcript_22472/g.33291 Transcript_22472/m.33291 type:complete len:886 (+) Transcript_22472:160-2817(+)